MAKTLGNVVIQALGLTLDFEGAATFTEIDLGPDVGAWAMTMHPIAEGALLMVDDAEITVTPPGPEGPGTVLVTDALYRQAAHVARALITDWAKRPMAETSTAVAAPSAGWRARGGVA